MPACWPSSPRRAASRYKTRRTFLTKQLLAAADKLPAAATVKAQVKLDLEKGLRLSKFVPHSDVTEAEVAKSPVVDIDFNFNPAFDIGWRTREMALARQSN